MSQTLRFRKSRRDSTARDLGDAHIFGDTQYPTPSQVSVTGEIRGVSTIFRQPRQVRQHGGAQLSISHPNLAEESVMGHSDGGSIDGGIKLLDSENLGGTRRREILRRPTFLGHPAPQIPIAGARCDPWTRIWPRQLATKFTNSRDGHGALERHSPRGCPEGQAGRTAYGNVFFGWSLNCHFAGTEV